MICSKNELFSGSIPWWRYLCNFIRSGWEGLDHVSTSTTFCNLFAGLLHINEKRIYFTNVIFLGALKNPHIASRKVVSYLTRARVPAARWSGTHRGHWIIERITNHVASFCLSYQSWQHRLLPHVYTMFVMRQKGSWPSIQVYPQPHVLPSFLRFTRLLWLHNWMEAFVALLQVSLSCWGGGRGGGGGSPLRVTSSQMVSRTCFSGPCKFNHCPVQQTLSNIFHITSYCIYGGEIYSFALWF